MGHSPSAVRGPYLHAFLGFRGFLGFLGHNPSSPRGPYLHDDERVAVEDLDDGARFLVFAEVDRPSFAPPGIVVADWLAMGRPYLFALIHACQLPGFPAARQDAAKALRFNPPVGGFRFAPEGA